MWVGGWVGQPKSRGANLTTPPPPSITKQRPGPDAEAVMGGPQTSGLVWRGRHRPCTEAVGKHDRPLHRVQRPAMRDAPSELTGHILMLSVWECGVRSAIGCTPPPPCISYAFVQATVGVGTVLIWDLILIRYQT